MTMQPFRTIHFPNLSGIPTDYLPVTPSDNADNVGSACTGLYATAAGNIRVVTRSGETRDIPVPAQTPLPILCSRVHAAGTTATGIFALQG